MVLGDGNAEGFPLLRITDCCLKSGLSYTHGAGRYVYPPGFQAAHHLAETLAFLHPHQIFGGDAVVLEYQLAGIQSPVAQLLQVPAYLEAVTALFHDKSADAPVVRHGSPIGTGQQAESIAIASIGDEHFTAVDDILLAILVSGNLQVSHVGSPARLGEGQAAPLATGSQVGQEMTLLLLGAVVSQHVGHYVVGADGPGDAHKRLAHFLENEGKGGVVQPHAAILFRHRNAEKPQFFHLVNQVQGNRVVPVQLGSNRLHLPADKILDQVDNLAAGFFGCLGGHEKLSLVQLSDVTTADRLRSEPAELLLFLLLIRGIYRLDFFRRLHRFLRGQP